MIAKAPVKTASIRPPIKPSVQYCNRSTAVSRAPISVMDISPMPQV